MSKKLLNTLPLPEKDFYIYALICPSTKQIKYIGLSTVGFNRMITHYKCGSGTKVKSWIKSLRNKKQIFEVKYLEYFDSDGPHIDEAEMKWIKYYKNEGLELLNLDIGGRSKFCKYHNEENKQIQSKLYKEMFNRPEMKQKFSEITKKQWQDSEIREKMCEANRKPKSESHKQNQKLAQTKSIGVKIQDDLGNYFESMKEAANYYKVCKSVIQRALYSSTKLLGNRKLIRIGGGKKPTNQLRPMNSYYKKVGT